MFRLYGASTLVAVLAKRFDGPTQARDLRGLSVGCAGPEIAQIAVMEAIREVVRDVCRKTGRQVPRDLWAIRSRGGDTQFVTREKPPNVHLIVRGSLHVVVAVGGVEVPLRPEVVVEANHAKVVTPGQRRLASKCQNI